MVFVCVYVYVCVCAHTYIQTRVLHGFFFYNVSVWKHACPRLPPLLVTSGRFSGTQTPLCCSCRPILSLGTFSFSPLVHCLKKENRNIAQFYFANRNILSLLTRRRMQRLGASKITQVDFLPREMVSYSKETQTPLTAHLSEGECLCLHMHE